jgi:hypothetical protein
MWFESLTGFVERSPGQVRANLSVEGIFLKSHINGRQFICGELETPSLAELRTRVIAARAGSGRISVRQEIADVQALHLDQANAGALFQVASQFNLLEMISPHITPEQGISGYEADPTQGPACAVAAGAGTIYRNYFVNLNGRTGQTADNQIDCLADLGKALGNGDAHLWQMKNGYVVASEDGLKEIADRIRSSSDREVDELRKLLRIGVQWNTQVTLGGSQHTVSQAYGSALPVAYSSHSPDLWEPFARLILEASYEATICTAIANRFQNGNNKVYLTLLGGGAFGNPTAWITGAIERALLLYQEVDLDVILVSFRNSNTHLQRLADRF